MTTDIRPVLKRLGLSDNGRYDDQFYIISVADSNDYAKMYTRLSNNAINTEYPGIGTNTSGATTKITNYFELEENNTKYLLFLIANFEEGTYSLKIKEAGDITA